MKTDNSSLMPALVAAVVAALVTGIGLFAFQSSQKPGPAASLASQSTPDQSSSAFSAAQEKSLQSLVHDYLVKNPEILVEMSSELDRKQTAAEQKTRIAAISKNAEKIYHENDPLVMGNPKGDVTIVEFFDYNCPYCKHAFASIAKLIESDPNVRVVMKEFPIFGEQSTGAAKVAIAASKQGKYAELHRALMDAKGRASEASALKHAEELGLDVDELKSDMELPEVSAKLEETRKLGEALGVQGTPFYLVGDHAVPGAPDNLYDIFVKTVADVRKNGCTAAC